MLNVSRLLCGASAPGDGLRYGDRVSGHGAIPRQRVVHHRPVVVWNITRRCNLHCIHCYSESKNVEYAGELSNSEAKTAIDDLASFGIPVVMFSGGEPLMRPDILDLVRYAGDAGLRTVLSTNGTQITPEVASDLKRAGLTYVGISIDGLKPVNDRFRGQKGAFEAAIAGIRHSMEAEFRVSLRFTLTRHNVADLGAIFDLVEQENIPRLCVYHLAYAGRGNKLLSSDLNHDETRDAMDMVFDRTLELYRRGLETEVLTVDNHADAVYLLHWLRRNTPEREAEVRRLLERNGGNSSGRGIACIDNVGEVHPDQFWRTRTLGNVRERPFSAIWQDDGIDLLHRLRNRRGLVKGRCARCGYFDLCNGNLRVRAESATGDTWAEDPACYLTDEELALSAQPVGSAT